MISTNRGIIIIIIIVIIISERRSFIGSVMIQIQRRHSVQNYMTY